MITAKITIEITPSPEIPLGDTIAELGNWLNGLGASSGSNYPAAQRPDWTPERAAALLRPMTAASRAVVRYVAKNAPVVQFDDVVAHLGMANRQTLGGTMASLGFSLKNDPGAKNPLTSNTREGTYMMDTDVAKVFLAAFDELESDRRGP